MKRFRFSLGRFLIVSVFIAFLIGLAFRARDQTRLEIQIIPNYFLKNDSKNIRLADQQPEVHFHVLITNKSHQAIRLWEEWNEWGYFNLAFDVVDGNGKVISTIFQAVCRKRASRFGRMFSLSRHDRFATAHLSSECVDCLLRATIDRLMVARSLSRNEG